MTIPQSAILRSLDRSRLHKLAYPADWLALLSVWRSRAEYRKELRRLRAVGTHMIDDLGLDQRDAETEAKKPFWVD